MTPRANGFWTCVHMYIRYIYLGASAASAAHAPRLHATVHHLPISILPPPRPTATLLPLPHIRTRSCQCVVPYRVILTIQPRTAARPLTLVFCSDGTTSTFSLSLALRLSPTRPSLMRSHSHSLPVSLRSRFSLPPLLVAMLDTDLTSAVPRSRPLLPPPVLLSHRTLAYTFVSSNHESLATIVLPGPWFSALAH